GTVKRALVVGVETMTSITNWTDRNSCVLFGDAAGAMVVEAAPADSNAGILDTAIYADGSAWEHLYIPAGGSKTRLTAELLASESDKIVMNGREVYKIAVRALVDAAEKILAKNGLKAS